MDSKNAEAYNHSNYGDGPGLSGSVLQTLTRNDLADPGILGINAGAGLGVTVAYLSLDFSGASIVYTLPIIGFVGAMGTFLITLMVAREKVVNSMWTNWF